MKPTWYQDSVELVESERIATTVPKKKKKIGYARSSSSSSIYKKKKNASSYSGPTGSIPICSLAFNLLWSQLLHADFILREISQLRCICQALWHLYVQTLSKHGKKRMPQKQLCGADNFPIWFFSWRRMATWQLFQYYTRSSFYVHRKKKDYPRQLAQL